jgi:hypothetical protein
MSESDRTYIAKISCGRTLDSFFLNAINALTFPDYCNLEFASVFDCLFDHITNKSTFFYAQIYQIAVREGDLSEVSGADLRNFLTRIETTIFEFSCPKCNNEPWDRPPVFVRFLFMCESAEVARKLLNQIRMAFGGERCPYIEVLL